MHRGVSRVTSNVSGSELAPCRANVARASLQLQAYRYTAGNAVHAVQDLAVAKRLLRGKRADGIGPTLVNFLG